MHIKIAYITLSLQPAWRDFCMLIIQLFSIHVYLTLFFFMCCITQEYEKYFKEINFKMKLLCFYKFTDYVLFLLSPMYIVPLYLYVYHSFISLILFVFTFRNFFLYFSFRSVLQSWDVDFGLCDRRKAEQKNAYIKWYYARDIRWQWSEFV